MLAAAARSGEPRLFLDPAKRDRLRRAIRVAGSTHALAWEQMKTRLAREEHWFRRSESNWNYGRSERAAAAALAYQLTGDKTYAQLAYDSLHAIHADPDPDRRLPEENYGLSRAATGFGFAVAWDYCREAWTAEQRQEIRARIDAALDAWPQYSHPNFYATRGSNWVGVCRGGELILLIGAGDEQKRAERLAFLIEQMRLHLANGYDELGVTQEGIGYCGYALSFVLPALLALRSIGNTALEAEAARHAWWHQFLLAGSFATTKDPAVRLYLMSGVGGPGIKDEGWASLNIPFVPREHQAEYLWFFDRHAGRLAKGAPLHRFDWDRGGGFWTLLCYPPDGKPAPPRRVPRSATGRYGTCFFRNRWQDENDIQVSLTASATHHGNAWSQPEALQVGLFFGGTVFFGGPVKERADSLFSALLVDGRNNPPRGSRTTGERIEFDASGYAIVGGGEKYRALGLESCRRHVLVHFEGDGALVATMDEFSAGAEHRLTWQAHLGGYPPTAPALTVERDGFLLRAPSGAWIRGWVVAPSAAEVQPAPPLRIHTKATQGRILVAMLLGRGPIPTGRVDGEELVLPSGRLRFDATTQRLRFLRASP
jgi:hypothetical protein